MKLLPHPIAECFPLLPLVELQAMSLDIAKNGLIHPIVIFEGKILEGRNRYRACQMAGVKPAYAQYNGSDPRGYVISANAMRRDLTKGQRACVAQELATAAEGGDHRTNSVSGELSLKEAAEQMGVSRTSAADARAIFKAEPKNLPEREGWEDPFEPGLRSRGLDEKRLPPSKSRTVDPDSFEPTAEELVERLAAAVDPEPVEKVTRKDSRPAEDLDPVSIVTPPEKSEFYLCRISRHCVWPPPSPLFLMDKSEPKPTPDTIQFANAPVVTLRTEFLDVQAKYAVAPIAFRETQCDFKRYAAVIAATSVEDVKVGDGEAFKDEKDLRSFMRWILRGPPGHKPTTAKA